MGISVLTGQQLETALSELRPQVVKGTCFRLLTLKYLNTPLSTTGAFKHGGRYNIVNEVGALYTSNLPITVLLELRALINIQDRSKCL